MLIANSNPDPYKWVYEKPSEDCPFREDMTPSEIAEIISDRVIEVLKKQFEEIKRSKMEHGVAT